MLRERWAITAGLGTIVLISTCLPMVLYGSLVGIPVRTLLWNCLSSTVIVLIPMPIAIAILQRSLRWQQQIVSAFWYLGVMTVLTFFTIIVERGGAEPIEVLAVLPFTLPTPLFLYFAVVGVVRSRVWYRNTLELERERRQFESAEASHARQVVERRSRPDIVGATLSRIEELLPDNPTGATALVHRLARYARTLMRAPAEPTLAESIALSRHGLRLQGVTTEITTHGPADSVREHADLIATAVEKAAVATRPSLIDIHVTDETVSIVSSSECLDEIHLRLNGTALQISRGSAITILRRTSAGNPAPERRPASPAETSSPVFATLVTMGVVCGSLATFNDLRASQWSSFLPLARTFALSSFIVAGPLLGFVSARAARLSFRAALMTTTAVAFATGVLITQAALTLAGRVVGAGDIPQGETWSHFAVYVFWRATMIAIAVAAIALAHALSGVWMAKRVNADRYRDELALAEARELEARFHPHALFNALASIAGLIRIDPAAAAAMCRRWSHLVREIVESAGLLHWPLDAELRLAASYLAIQRMRFGDRILVESWDVPHSAANVEVPRLLLQPLLENAIKHAVARHDDGTSLGLRIRRQNHHLTLELWNDARDCNSDVPFGRGLLFVRRRVEAAGGEFTIDTGAPGRFAVRCSIPLG